MWIRIAHRMSVADYPGDFWDLEGINDVLNDILVPLCDPLHLMCHDGTFIDKMSERLVCLATEPTSLNVGLSRHKLVVVQVVVTCDCHYNL